MEAARATVERVASERDTAVGKLRAAESSRRRFLRIPPLTAPVELALMVVLLLAVLLAFAAVATWSR